MNDFHMATLAGERIANFHAEADRQRLARTTQRVPTQQHRTEQRTRRPSLRLIFGRVTVL